MLLAAALPAFLIAGWPLAGYAAMATAWLAQRAVNLAARRRAERQLAAGERRGALATVGWSTMGRAWFVAAVVLVAGLIEREAGLSGGILAAALFTVYFSTLLIVTPIEESRK